MDRLREIAAALAQDLPELEAGAGVQVEVDAERMLHVRCTIPGTAWHWRLEEQPVGLTVQEEDAACEALLRLGADTRWLEGLVGGLDPQGRLSVMASQVPAASPDAAEIEGVIARLQGRLAQALQAGWPWPVRAPA